ncbi:hypothetical protein [Okeania sp. SIO2F5]|nr:hypothetical protein [Okeania sp. SIO2F5]
MSMENGADLVDINNLVFVDESGVNLGMISCSPPGELRIADNQL